MAAKLKALQQWCKLRCDGYRDVQITNMTSAWKSGLAFCAIIHRFRPDLIDYDSLSKENVFENNQLAFDVANEQLDIAALLDADDMVMMAVPDKLCIITYVAQYYMYFRDKEQLGGPGVKSRVAVKRPSPSSKATSPPLSAKRFSSDQQPDKQVAGSGGRGTLTDRCRLCGERVYVLERHLDGTLLYHRRCFRGAERSASVRAPSHSSAAVRAPPSAAVRGPSATNGTDTSDVIHFTHEERSGAPAGRAFGPGALGGGGNGAAPDSQTNHRVAPLAASPTNAPNRAAAANVSTGAYRVAAKTASNFSTKTVPSYVSTKTLQNSVATKTVPTNVSKLDSSSNVSTNAASSSVFTRTVSPSRVDVLPVSAVSTVSPVSAVSAVSSPVHVPMQVDVSEPAKVTSHFSKFHKAPEPPGKDGLRTATVDTGRTVGSEGRRGNDGRTQGEKGVGEAAGKQTVVAGLLMNLGKLRRGDEMRAVSHVLPVSATGQTAPGPPPPPPPPTDVRSPTAPTPPRGGSRENSPRVGSPTQRGSPSVTSPTAPCWKSTATNPQQTAANEISPIRETQQASRGLHSAESRSPVEIRFKITSATEPSSVADKSVLRHRVEASSTLSVQPGSRTHKSAVENGRKVSADASCAVSRAMAASDSNAKSVPRSVVASSRGSSDSAPSITQRTSIVKWEFGQGPKPAPKANGVAAVSARLSVPAVAAGGRKVSVKTSKVAGVTASKQQVSPRAADRSGVSANLVSKMVDRPGVTADRPSVMTGRAGVTADRPGVTADRPGVTADRPGVTADRPGVTADRPGVTADRAGMAATLRDALQPKSTIKKPAMSDALGDARHPTGDTTTAVKDDQRVEDQRGARAGAPLEWQVEAQRREKVRAGAYDDPERRLARQARYFPEEQPAKPSLKRGEVFSVRDPGGNDGKLAGGERKVAQPDRSNVQREGERKMEWQVEADRRHGATKYKNGEPAAATAATAAALPVVPEVPTRPPPHPSSPPPEPVAPPRKRTVAAPASRISFNAHDFRHAIDGTDVVCRDLPTICPPRATPAPAAPAPATAATLRPDKPARPPAPFRGTYDTLGAPPRLGDMYSAATDGFGTPAQTPKRRVNAEERMSTMQISTALYHLDMQLCDLEQYGRELEVKIRSQSDEAMDSSDDFMVQWFGLVNQKNELVRKEADLMYRKKQQELEDIHEDLEFELRCLMDKPDHAKTSSEKIRERSLLNELLDTISQRNSIVDSIEDDRIRYIEEDQEIADVLADKAFNATAKNKKNKKNKKKEKKAKAKSLALKT